MSSRFSGILQAAGTGAAAGLAGGVVMVVGEKIEQASPTDRTPTCQPGHS